MQHLQNTRNKTLGIPKAVPDRQRAWRLTGLLPALGSAAGFSVVLSISQLAIPLYSMQLFDRVLPSTSLPTLVTLGIITALLITGSIFIDAVRTVLLNRMACRIDGQCYEHLATLAVSDPNVGMPLLRDLDMIRSFLTGPFVTAILDVPCSLAFIAMIFVLHPLLGYISLAASLLMFILGVSVHYVTQAHRLEAVQASASSGRIFDGIGQERDGMDSMGMRRRTVLKLSAFRMDYAAASRRASERQAWIEATSRGVRSIVQVLLLACAAFLVLSGTVETGAIVAASMLFGRALVPFERLAGGFHALSGFASASRRIAGTAARFNELPIRFDLPKLKGGIEIANLSYSLRNSQRPVLSGINISLRPSHLLAVVGREGSGKSTLARMIVGAQEPTTGDIRLEGSRLSDFDEEALGDQIGFLPEVTWFQQGTVADFISRSRSAPDASEMIRAAELFGVHSFIQTLPQGYQTEICTGRFPLSASQRQRLALARAFFGRPRIIVLDEPTSHLDDTGEMVLLKAIQELKSGGTSFVVVSRLPGLLHLADQLLMLDAGEVRLSADQNQMQKFLAPRLATS